MGRQIKLNNKVQIKLINYMNGIKKQYKNNFIKYNNRKKNYFKSNKLIYK